MWAQMWARENITLGQPPLWPFRHSDCGSDERARPAHVRQRHMRHRRAGAPTPRGPRSGRLEKFEASAGSARQALAPAGDKPCGICGSGAACLVLVPAASTGPVAGRWESCPDASPRARSNRPGLLFGTPRTNPPFRAHSHAPRESQDGGPFLTVRAGLTSAVGPGDPASVIGLVAAGGEPAPENDRNLAR
jgi:hypothetical protein